MSRGNSLNQRQSFEDRLITAFGGMSLKQIAEKLGVKYTSLWNWAKGRTAFPLDKLAVVGQLTGYSINWLLTGEGDRLTVETRVFSDSELAVKVNELDHKLFTIELFVVELARLNEFFRKMLTPDSFERAHKIFNAWAESIESFDEYGEAIRESSAESTIQQLGAVDEFLAASIRKYDNALLVLRDWYGRDNVAITLPQTLDFQGWETMTLEEKVREIRGAREIIDHNHYLEERLEASRRIKSSK